MLRKIRLLALAGLGALGLGLGGPLGATSVPVPVGQVLFSLGDASRVDGTGASQPLMVGTQIFAGDALTTGAKSYVHVRMIDQALVVVRPESRLNVAVYEFDSTRPQASKIKLELVNGNSRTVSGRGGEAARQNYRFNTPVVAVGLRGTDYTVTVNQDVSRISVARGAVVVTPFGNGCSSAGFGPCISAMSQELSAEQRHAYLEVSAKARIPTLVLPEQDPPGAANQNPSSRPAEPNAKRESGKTDTLAVQRIPDKEAVKPETVNALVAEDALASASKLYWGRWNPGPESSASRVLPLLTPGREITVGNDEYGLVRSIGVMDLPTQGTFNFSLAGSDAMVRAGSVAEPARVLGGNFAIDFYRRGFDTNLLVQHSRGVENLSASGGVTYQGFLFSNPNVSNMSVNGAVASTGQEAAYLFEKSLLSNRTLFGATRWVR